MYEYHKQIVVRNASIVQTARTQNVAISAVRRSIATVLIEANQICNVSEYKFGFVIFLHCFLLFTANFIYINLVLV